jgi:hypothetical protein
MVDLIQIINLFCGGGIFVFAIVAIFWNLAYPMFLITGLYFVWIVFNFPMISKPTAREEQLDRAHKLSMLPNLALGIGLAISYSLLLLKNEDSIQQKEMPDNWEVYNIVLCVFMALHAALLEFKIIYNTIPWLSPVAYVCILFAYIFLFIQYMMSTYFHVDG